LEALGLNASWTNLNANCTAVIVDAKRAASTLIAEAEDAGAAGEEVARVVKGVEANEIDVEESAEEGLALRKRAEDFTRGERGVHEKANARVEEAVSKKGGQKHEMVVVDPHAIEAWIKHLGDALGVQAVSVKVGVP